MLKVNLSSFDTACVETEITERFWVMSVSSSFDTACVETPKRDNPLPKLKESSFDTACVETLCLNPRSIKRETYEFAVDRQLCKNALQIDSKVSV